MGLDLIKVEHTLVCEFSLLYKKNIINDLILNQELSFYSNCMDLEQINDNEASPSVLLYVTLYQVDYSEKTLMLFILDIGQ